MKAEQKGEQAQIASSGVEALIEKLRGEGIAVPVLILTARDATAHAPSPSWMDVDRQNLKGRISTLPKRDELIQIPINEQLIVELYSK